MYTSAEILSTSQQSCVLPHQMWQWLISDLVHDTTAERSTALRLRDSTSCTLGWSDHCSGHLAASTQAAELSWQARQRVQSGTWLHRAQSGASQSAHAQIQCIHGHAWYNHLLGGGYDQKDASGNRDNCNGCWVSFSWTLLEAMEKLSISNSSGSAQVEGAITPLHHGAVCLKE